MFHQNCIHGRQPEPVTGKGWALLFSNTPSEDRISTVWTWLETVPSTVCFLLCSWHPSSFARSCQERTGLICSFYLRYVHCVICPIHFLLSSILSLFRQEMVLILTRCHGFFFFFFQRRGCFTGQKPQMCKKKMQDRRTIFYNDQVHNSQLFRNLLWLH